MVNFFRFFSIFRNKGFYYNIPSENTKTNGENGLKMQPCINMKSDGEKAPQMPAMLYVWPREES